MLARGLTGVALADAAQRAQLFRGLKIKFAPGCVSGPCLAQIGQAEVHVHDKDQGYTYLGTGNGEFELPLSTVPSANIDAMDQVRGDSSMCNALILYSFFFCS